MRKMRYLQGACALAITAGAAWAIAADHLDGAAAKADASADITDLYAWASGDKVTLIMNVSPLASMQSQFSDAVQYAFHLENSGAYGMPGEKTDIVCTFDATQNITCVLGTPGGNVADVVKGNANVTTGIMSDSQKMKAYAGLRADPFYFNFAGFNDAVATVKNVAGTLTFDTSGCPTVDATTSTLLIGMLQGTNMGAGAAENFFATANVLSIVLEIDKSLLAGGNIVAVWSSTHKG